MNDKEITVNEDVLLESFIPINILHRQDLVKVIEKLLSPNGDRIPTSIYISGPPGSGKTLAIKALKKKFPNSLVYVNCWNCRTEHKIFVEILQQLGLVIHERESTNELERKLARTKRRVVICLDEADQINDKRILYTLARNGFGIVIISNQPYVSGELDNRIKSSLFFSPISFKPYSQDELIDILRDRADSAYRPSSVPTELIKSISEMASGDARAGLLMLRAAAKNAESRGQSRVAEEDVKAAAKGGTRLRLSYLLKKLNEHQRIIFQILRKGVKMSSGRLFEEYVRLSESPVTDRAYRKYMEIMVDLGIVKSEGSGRWKKYQTSIE